MAIQVIPTGAALGAEIRGVDFSRPVPEDVKPALRKAWSEHMVLLFRGQGIDDDHLLEASGVFGPPHEAASRKYHLAVGEKVDDKLISLWDNRCCMHYRTEIDTQYRRVMHRTTIKGEPLVAA